MHSSRYPFPLIVIILFLLRIEFCNMLRRGCNEIREKEEGISKNCEDENLMQDDNKKLKYFKRYKWNKGWIIILFLFIYFIWSIIESFLIFQWNIRIEILFKKKEFIADVWKKWKNTIVSQFQKIYFFQFWKYLYIFI